jgi:hypothetical protein
MIASMALNTLLCERQKKPVRTRTKRSQRRVFKAMLAIIHHPSSSFEQPT